MKKIKNLFCRNFDGDGKIFNEIEIGSEWVVAGEGIATRKWDGTCCMIRDGRLYKRYDAKYGRTPPANFEPAQETPDEVTGHWPGWVPVTEHDKWHLQAFSKFNTWVDGTYELCGPKVQSNPEKFPDHVLIPHGDAVLSDVPRDFDGLREYFSVSDIEGVVWHHQDGRMVKVRGGDFGIKRGRA